MINFKAYVPAVLISIFTFSCDPCQSVDCNSSNYFGKFRVISKDEGKDLAFGSNTMYDKSRIKFYSVKGRDTTVFDYQPISAPGPGYDSVLYVYFYPKPAVAYMRLSNGDVDTFNLSYKTFESKCCGTITDIASFRINNSIDSIAGGNTVEVRK